MHNEVTEFLRETKRATGELFVSPTENHKSPYFNNCKVLEIGSYVTDTQLEYKGVRNYFVNCDITGVDIVPGPCVDVVCRGHEFKSPILFKTAVACEVFEHDPFWDKTVQNMIDLLEWNGLLIFTCASTGRPEHGTRRTALDNNDNLNTDTVYSEDEDYYRNLTKEDFQAKVPAFTNGTLVGGYWVQNEGSQDLYYRGWKR
jgi:hypothetical protein